MSDLHLEFQNEIPDFPIVDRDVLILAGDVHVGTKADAFILSQLEHGDVIYVLGNHEFFHQIMPTVRAVWSSATSARINSQAATEGFCGTLYVLDDNAVTLNGVTFIGSTLWTDFDNNNPTTMLLAERIMYDYRVIYTGIDIDGQLTKHTIYPDEIFTIHQRSRRFIECELEKPGKKVLITHQAFSWQSVSEEFQGDALNPMFVSDLDSWFFDHDDIVLAIHGHMHSSVDYMIDRTRVICNPRGYHPDMLNPSFNPSLTITI